jgi:hypothetical protein
MAAFLQSDPGAKQRETVPVTILWALRRSSFLGSNCFTTLFGLIVSAEQAISNQQEKAGAFAPAFIVLAIRQQPTSRR